MRPASCKRTLQLEEDEGEGEVACIHPPALPIIHPSYPHPPALPCPAPHHPPVFHPAPSGCPALPTPTLHLSTLPHTTHLCFVKLPLALVQLPLPL